MRLRAARLALRPSRRCVRQDRDAAKAHRLRLIHERGNHARVVAITLALERTVVADREHVERGDVTVLREADLHPAAHSGTTAADEMLFLAADSHHHRGIRLLRQQHGDQQRNGAGDLAAESSTGVLADDDDVFGRDADPSGDARHGLGSTLRAGVDVHLAVLPVRHDGPGFQCLVAGVRCHECLVEHQGRILEAGVEVAVRPLLGRVGHDGQLAVLCLGQLRRGVLQLFDLGTWWGLRLASAALCPLLRRCRRRNEPVVALGPGVRTAGTQAHQRIDAERKRLEIDLDLFDCVRRGDLVDRCDGQDRLTLIDGLVRERDFAIEIGEDHLAVVVDGVGGLRQIVGGENRLDAGHRQRRARVETRHTCVRHGTQQELGEDHPFRAKVLGVLGFSRDLRDQVGNRVVLSDEFRCRHDHALRRFSAPRIMAVRILS